MKYLGASLFLLSALLLYLVYDGYGRVLAMLAWRRGDSAAPNLSSSPAPRFKVSVVVPVFNEERRIRRKLDNLFAQDFPAQRFEVIVVSDGSTDATDRIVAEYSGRVRFISTSGRVGKSLAQNQAVAVSSGEIIVLTDVAAIMDSDCLSRLVAPFGDAGVGCVTARLLFGADGSMTGDDQGTYWRYELKLRRLESQLGLLATAAGPAMAIRRSLWRDLVAEYGDDCVLPLDVVLQGSRVMQAEDAIARDEAFETAQMEYAARIRMTVRNWLGTFSRAELLNPLRHPGYAAALWCHKILRWLSPTLLIGWVIGAGMMAVAGGPVWPLVVVALAAGMAGVGMLALFSGRRIPVLATAGSFLLANAAFLVGVSRALRGRAVRVYQNQPTRGSAG